MLGVGVADPTAVTVSPLTNDRGPGLSLTSVGTPSHGTVSVSGGQVVYTPAQGYTGADFFTYVASSGTSTATATVYIGVGTAPAGPSASPLLSTGPGGAAQTVTVPVPASGRVQLLLPGTSTVVNRLHVPGEGTYTVGDPGSGVIAFTPASGYSGTATSVNYPPAGTAIESVPAALQVTCTLSAGDVLVQPAAANAGDATDSVRPPTTTVLASSAAAERCHEERRRAGWAWLIVRPIFSGSRPSIDRHPAARL